jgi:transcriptional regulator with XRE-family HTH domain
VRLVVQEQGRVREISELANRVEDAGPHPVDRHVGRRVAQRRTGLGYNQGDLGRALGLTFQQVQKYEKGINRISASKLWLIAQFLKVDIAWFFDGLAGPDVKSDSLSGRGARHDPEQPRQDVEISTIALRLSKPRQKLMRDLMRELAPEGED